MIFVTTGTQAPFDRFIKMVDELAIDLNEEIIAQAISSKYQPKNIVLMGFISPDEYDKIFAKARIIISHAGMGTIISALREDKPIVVVPRLASLKEHRSDHQLATAMRMNELGYVHVAYDKKQLRELFSLKDKLPCLKSIHDSTPKSLVDSLVDFMSTID